MDRSVDKELAGQTYPKSHTQQLNVQMKTGDA